MESLYQSYNVKNVKFTFTLQNFSTIPVQVFWLTTREEYTLSSALDFQAIPAIRYVTLSQYGTPGATKVIKYNPNLNKLRVLEDPTVQVIYNTVGDPTPSGDLLFLNMFVQALDQSSFTGSVVV